MDLLTRIHNLAQELAVEYAISILAAHLVQAPPDAAVPAEFVPGTEGYQLRVPSEDLATVEKVLEFLQIIGVVIWSRFPAVSGGFIFWPQYTLNVDERKVQP